MSRWYYTLDNRQRLGPVTTEQLRALVLSEVIRPECMVKGEVGRKWVPAGTVKGLFAETPEPPPGTVTVSCPTCSFCNLPRATWGLFCARCGGEFRELLPLERLLLRLESVRTLMRNRVWLGLADGVKAIQKALKDDPALRGPSEKALIWLGQETESLVDADANLPRLLNVAKAVLDLLPANTFSQLRAHVSGLRGFMDAVLQAEQTWARGKVPRAGKIQAWFDSLAQEAGLYPRGARGCVYASPHLWPTVAAALDPAAYEAARPLISLAAGDKLLKDKHYAAARKLFEDLRTRHPKNVLVLEKLASVLVAMDEIPYAIQCYREAVRLRTCQPLSYNNLSWYLCTLGQPTGIHLAEALWAAKRAVELAPIGTCWDTLAEARERGGDLPGAIAATREAIRYDPERESYRSRMRRLCEQVPSAPTPVARQSDEEGDIFEDHFAAPALDDSAVDLESTGVGPALSDKDLASEEECASQVMALEDEGEVDEGAQTVARQRSARGAPVLEEGEEEVEVLIDMGAPGEEEEAEEEAAHPPERVGAAGRSEPEAANTEIARPITDQVHFSVTAPATLRAGNSYLLDVWAHLAKQREEVIRRAREAQRGKEIHIRSKGGTRVARGTSLAVRLCIPSFVVDDPENIILWDGDIGNAAFPFRVPREIETGSYNGTIRIFAEALEVAKVHFDLEVGAREAQSQPLPVKEHRFRSAFASYASQDRDEVLARVQGIQKVIPHLDVFLDVARLRSGERWADRIVGEVCGRDVFYLFWSAHARESEWVRREWQTALSVRGIDYIDPVPLAPPEEVPPPPELASHLHFNDWVLAYMRKPR